MVLHSRQSEFRSGNALTHLDEIPQQKGQFLDLVLGRRVRKPKFAQHAGEEFTVVLFRQRQLKCFQCREYLLSGCR